jgi:alpha-beta hydrolase superfamily lysophospholipase
MDSQEVLMHYKEGQFKGYQGFNIYYQSWLPEDEIKAVLLIAHGFAEHSGRYGNVVNYFVPKGCVVGLWTIEDMVNRMEARSG